MARPSKLTPEVQKRIIDAIRAGNYAAQAARSAGIGSSTFYRWMEQGATEDAPQELREFRDSVKKAEAEAEVAAVAIIRREAQNGTWQAAAWYLERKYADRWGRQDRLKQQVEVTMHDGDSIDAEVRRLAEILDSSKTSEMDTPVSQTGTDTD